MWVSVPTFFHDIPRKDSGVCMFYALTCWQIKIFWHLSDGGIGAAFAFSSAELFLALYSHIAVYAQVYSGDSPISAFLLVYKSRYALRTYLTQPASIRSLKILRAG